MWTIELTNAIGNQTYDITSRVEAFNISYGLNKANSFSLTAHSIHEWHLYDYIVIYKYGELFASGRVIKQSDSYKSSLNGLYKVTTMDCTDFSNLLTARTVAEIYRNKTASQIIQHTLQYYVPEITTHSTQFLETGIVIPEVIFPYTTALDVVEKVLDSLYNWYWYIDQYRKFHLFYKTENAVKVTAKDILIDTLRIDKTGESIANRVWVIGSSYAATNYTEQTFAGDGVNRYFNLSYEPNYTECYLNGVAAKVLSEPDDNDHDCAFLVDKKAHLLYIPPYVTTPYTGTILCKYRATQQQIDLQQNQTSIDNYGFIDKVVKDSTFKTSEQVKKYARAELKRSSELPEARKISFSTRNEIRVGQKVLLDITMPLVNVMGTEVINSTVKIQGTFRVNEVQIDAIVDDTQTYDTLTNVTLEEVV